MNITAITSGNLYLPYNPPKNQRKQLKEQKSNGYIAAAALGAAVLAGGVTHWHYNKQIKVITKKFNDEIDIIRKSNTYREIQRLRKENKELADKNKFLQIDNDCYSTNNSFLEDSIQYYEEQIMYFIESDTTPVEYRKKLIDKFKKIIRTKGYGYDISDPPIPTLITPIYTHIMPQYVGTLNRATMQKLNIPKISKDGSFSFEIPTSDEIKITHEHINFSPVKNKESTVALSYGNSVQWNSDKVARDLLQNFFDGHGQTLDGVRFLFTPIGEGRYRVRLEGKSTYTPEKAIYLGLSSKQFDSKAAGNYGEGIKMAALKLLSDAGASDVKIASDNWKCTWTIGNSGLNKDVQVMYYSVDKTSEKFNGNYVEFETNNPNLLESLRNTIDRFYHSHNDDFKCPDFENHLFGIKVLPQKDQTGSIYIAGQKFEFNGSFNGLKGLNIFIKEKPPISVHDPSRDRTSLNTSHFESIAEWLGKSDSISFEEKLAILKTLEKYWVYECKEPIAKFIEKFLISMCSGNYDKAVQFSDRYIANTYNSSEELLQNLKSKGYIICRPEFKNIGMQNISDFLKKIRAHDVVIPNETEKNKILILREAINTLSTALIKHFKSEELDTHIYMFDRNAEKEKKIYEDCDAEAIIDNYKSKGFWIDRTYLNNTTFCDALETALHELSHKMGGDESSTFSYMLTNVNSSVLQEILNNSETKAKLFALEKLWN